MNRQYLYVCQEAFDALEGTPALQAAEEGKRLLEEMRKLLESTQEQADRAEDEADRAEAEADRAAQTAILGVRAENLEAVWKLEENLPANGELELPVSYFAGRNMLHLSYDGVELYRGVQYEEVGEKDEISSSVKILIPLSSGMIMHAWAVASNVARLVEEAEQAAQDAADRAEQEADRAEQEADRAEDAAQAAELGSSAFNHDATWTQTCPVEPGDSLILPLLYWPGRSMLYLSANRKDLFRGVDYVEIPGKGPNGLSDRVKAMCNIPAGTVLHAWVIASNVSRVVDRAEKRARLHAKFAGKSAKIAVDAAERAEAAASDAEISKGIAQNAAQEATEQADRADDAAIDAGKYRDEAMKAADCAAMSMQARSLASIQRTELLEKVPSGFYVVDAELVLPGTCQHPLTPVDGVDSIPNMDGFFLVTEAFPPCPPETEKPDNPDEPDNPDGPDNPGTGDSGGLPPQILPCGKRARP